MEKELLSRNEKREIIAMGNVVVKRFLYYPSWFGEGKWTEKDARRRTQVAQNALQVLGEKFGIIKINGWTYRSVQFLGIGPQGTSLDMEYVKTPSIDRLSTKDIVLAEYHAGVWLGLYHQKLFLTQHKSMLFSDFTLYNLLVDFEHQTMVAIDPGDFWGRHGYNYEDILFHIHSIMAFHFKKKWNPVPACHKFLKGYIAVNQNHGLFAYYKALIRQWKKPDKLQCYGRQKSTRIFGFSVSKKWAFRVFSFMLVPFYVVYLPACLTWFQVIVPKVGNFGTKINP